MPSSLPEARVDPALLRAWLMARTGTVMLHGSPVVPGAPVPHGYMLRLTEDGPVTAVEILAPDGTEAARGFAAELDGVFIYDRIRTHEAHQRRGLGRAVMTALGAARRSPASVEILVATDAGRALYEQLGWTALAPYSTAVIAS